MRYAESPTLTSGSILVRLGLGQGKTHVYCWSSARLALEEYRRSSRAEAEAIYAAAIRSLEDPQLRITVRCDHCRNGAHHCSGERCDCSCSKVVIEENE